MKPLSWLMLATHVPPSGMGGGMVRYVVELATALAARPDVELSVLTTASAQPFFRRVLGDKPHLQTVPTLPTAARSVWEREFWGVGSRRSFDVVHGTKHLIPRRAQGHRALTVHDMLLMDIPEDFN